MLGAGGSAIALPWPRAHILNLLGAEPLLGLPQWSAIVALGLLSFGYLGFALMRAPE
jgi:hypothetical protein